MIPRPEASEYAPFYNGYVQCVPEGSDIFDLLSQQPDELNTLLQLVNEEQANHHPAPGEWSIKEVIGHIADTERVFAYRAVRIARGDTTPLSGFDQDAFVKGTDFNSRTLKDLLAEFSLQRQANVLCLKPLTGAEIARQGTASNAAVTVRAILYILAGHVIHHIESLKTSYKVGG
ncbi:MAG: DinB family protein [Anaerolineae bacterium]|nr:DinB family protein [Anaerolineae bacterium]